jgi:hypothetical protein
MLPELPAWINTVGPGEVFWLAFLTIAGGRWVKRKANGGTVSDRLARLETKVDLIMSAMKLTPKD